MKTFRVLCYLPSYKDGHWLDNGIDLWSRLWNLKADDRLRCSHTELWFPDILGNYEQGVCFTSTMRDNVNGVVMRASYKVLTNPERWDYFEIPCTDGEYANLISWCTAEAAKGQKYGTLTIATFFLPVRFRIGGRPVCSDICCEAMQRNITVMKAALSGLRVPSPTRLAYYINKAGFPEFSLETGNIVVK